MEECERAHSGFHAARPVLVLDLGGGVIEMCSLC